MGKSFKDMANGHEAQKSFRIVQNARGESMKRVFDQGPELKYKDVEMSLEERYEFDSLYDVPH